MTHKAYSTLMIKAVHESDDGKRIFEGIASTPTPDRDKDIVEPKGGEFKLPIPFLWMHAASEPIGWITHAKATKEGIEVKGKVADVPEEGALKARLLEKWQMIKHGLVRGLSIGFRPLEFNWIEATGGMHILKWEWYELSAVTIPANQEATILAVKSAALGHVCDPGASGKRVNQEKGVTKMSLREQLAKLTEARATKAARIGELMDSVKGGTATVEAVGEFDQLTGEIESSDTDIRLKRAEIAVARTADPVETSVKTGPTIISKKTDQEDKFKGQAYTRMVIAKAVAQLKATSPLAVAQERWGRTNPLLVEVMKAAVAGGGTGSGEWGAELVTANSQYTGDFIEYLHGITVYDKVGLREIPANVLIKGQDGAATGYWVGESKPIPVSKPDFFNVTLSRLKVAALSVVSNELLLDSSPSAELLVRDALGEASSQRVDATFLSADAAVAGVSPAGILNGVTGGSTSGNDAAGVRADIKSLFGPFLTAKNAKGLKLVMSPAMALSIGLMQNALGQDEFKTLTAEGGTLLGIPVVIGDNVAANDVILLKPSDIYRIGDSGLEVALSREATIEMDTAPTGASDTPVGASTAQVNMFQSNSTAIRVIRSINFAKRRSSVVQFITDAAYGDES